jgi:hypothetical protein
VLGERHVAPASSLSKYPSPAEIRSVSGDVPIAVEIEAAAPSLLVIHEW